MDRTDNSNSTLIIYAHPQGESLNSVIFSAIELHLKEKGTPLKIIDLYADGFNPVMTAEEACLYNSGKYIDSRVGDYMNALSSAERVIFIFPVWWGEMPAILKGFFDKVMIPGFGYTISPEGAMLPGLQISQTLIVTTSGGGSDVLAPYFEGYFIPQVLSGMGFSGCRWMNCPDADNVSDEQKATFIALLTEAL